MPRFPILARWWQTCSIRSSVWSKACRSRTWSTALRDIEQTQTLLLQPFHDRNLAAAFANAGDRLAQRLDLDHHMKGVGMNEGLAIAHDRHMPSPEQEIATLETTIGGIGLDWAAERLLLQVGVARC